MPRTLWALALPLLVALAAPAGATAVKKLEDAELVRAAKLIGHLECVSSTPEWGPDNRRIFTRVRFSVRAIIKGDETLRDVEILLPGGERDGRVYAVHGMPRFQEGEEVVLFLTGEHPRSKVCVPVGLGQGLFRIRRRADRAPLAVRDTRELLLVESGASPARGKLERVDLDELLGQVRSEVRSQAAAERAEREGRGQSEAPGQERRPEESGREERR